MNTIQICLREPKEHAMGSERAAQQARTPPQSSPSPQPPRHCHAPAPQAHGADHAATLREVVEAPFSSSATSKVVQGGSVQQSADKEAVEVGAVNATLRHYHFKFFIGPGNTKYVFLPGRFSLVDRISSHIHEWNLNNCFRYILNIK